MPYRCQDRDIPSPMERETLLSTSQWLVHHASSAQCQKKKKIRNKE